MSFEALNLASSLLTASRLGIDVAAANLNGLNDPNYVRQTAVIQEASVPPSPWMTQGVDGMGVQVAGIQRASVELLNYNYRVASQNVGSPQAAQGWLSQLQSQLEANPGLADQAQALAQTASTLVSQPASAALRSQFLAQAQDLTSQLNGQAQGLITLASQSRQDLSSQVTQASQLLTQLANLNGQIVGAAKDTMGTNELLNQRDKFLDQLNGLMDVQTSLQPNGEVAVYQNGNQLVWAAQAKSLSLSGSNQVVTNTGEALQIDSGAIAGLSQVVNQTIPGYQNQLNTLAAGLINTVNPIHQQGYGTDGGTGRNLFSGTSAVDIGVAITDPSQLASATLRLQSSSAIGSTSFQPDATMNSQAANLTTPLAATGSVLVNGVTVNYTDGQSLNSILASLQAGGVQAQYDPNTRQVSLQRDPTWVGPAGLSISDTTGNLTTVLGIAGQTAAPGGPSDGATMLALSNALNGASYGGPPPQTLNQAFTSLVTQAGQAVSQNNNDLSRQQAIQTSAQDQRSQSAGVSQDNELMDLQKWEQAYNAAAKVAQVANETLSSLLTMVV